MGQQQQHAETDATNSLSLLEEETINRIVYGNGSISLASVGVSASTASATTTTTTSTIQEALLAASTTASAPTPLTVSSSAETSESASRPVRCISPRQHNLTVLQAVSTLTSTSRTLKITTKKRPRSIQRTQWHLSLFRDYKIERITAFKNGDEKE